MHFCKNLFDISLAFIILFFLLIPFCFIFIITTLDTKKNGLFIHKRVGKNGKLFNLYKFRSMKTVYSSSITTNKMNITKVGSFIRKYKIDEWPQLFNILKGDMSWVGPRPDVPGYADKLENEDRIILSCKPGITGPAQIKYRNEEKILSQITDPKTYNDEIIWKDKIKINKEYIKNWNFYKDLYYIWKTFV